MFLLTLIYIASCVVLLSAAWRTYLFAIAAGAPKPQIIAVLSFVTVATLSVMALGVWIMNGECWLSAERLTCIFAMGFYR